MQFKNNCPKCGSQINFFRLFLLTTLPIIPGFNDGVKCPGPACNQTAKYRITKRLTSVFINLFTITLIISMYVAATWPVELSIKSIVALFWVLFFSCAVGVTLATLYFLSNINYE